MAFWTKEKLEYQEVSDGEFVYLWLLIRKLVKSKVHRLYLCLALLLFRGHLFDG